MPPNRRFRHLSTALRQDKLTRRLKIGITGKFASGKSEVLRIFSDAGFAVCSADEIAHALLGRENSVSKKVLKIFGSGILDKDGIICRQKLGDKVFGSEPLMRELEKIMHPAIKSEMEKFLAANPVCAAENALLFKMGMQNCFDKIILVKCSGSVREKNIAARGISPSEAEKIFSFQKDVFYPGIKRGQVPFLRKGTEKKGTCPLFIIENNGGLPALRRKTKKLIDSLSNISVR